MARIRSIHPGFFTDEDLVSTSMAARLLFIGLGVEADDKGVFVWKPLTIKMRIFPADNLDVVPLLEELVGAGAIQKYEIDGREYGAIRNFRKFQKPKTPNDIHPAPNHIRNYVGLEATISEPFPQKGEKSPQMEDGGGKREEGEETEEAAIAESDYVFSGRVIKLKADTFAAWSKAYPDIDLPAVLQSRDDWLVQNDRQKNWFIATSNHLSKLQQAVKTQARQPEQGMPC